MYKIGHLAKSTKDLVYTTLYSNVKQCKPSKRERNNAEINVKSVGKSESVKLPSDRTFDNGMSVLMRNMIDNLHPHLERLGHRMPWVARRRSNMYALSFQTAISVFSFEFSSRKDCDSRTLFLRLRRAARVFSRLL